MPTVVEFRPPPRPVVSSKARPCVGLLAPLLSGLTPVRIMPGKRRFLPVGTPVVGNADIGGDEKATENLLLPTEITSEASRDLRVTHLCHSLLSHLGDRLGHGG